MKSFTSYVNEKLILNKSLIKEKITVSSKSELKNYIESYIEKTGNEDYINLNNVDISALKDLTRLFRSYKFKYIVISKWDVSNIENMMFMFPKTLEKVDLSDWDVSNVQNMDGMFAGCKNLSEIGNISKWDTRSLKSAKSMFEECEKIKEIDISEWNFKSLVNVTCMFYGCISLESIGNIPVDLRNISNSTNIFLFCKKLKLQ